MRSTSPCLRLTCFLSWSHTSPPRMYHICLCSSSQTLWSVLSPERFPWSLLACHMLFYFNLIFYFIYFMLFYFTECTLPSLLRIHILFSLQSSVLQGASVDVPVLSLLWTSLGFHDYPNNSVNFALTPITHWLFSNQKIFLNDNNFITYFSSVFNVFPAVLGPY